MKVVILAGGMGTRLAEETSIIPKPMVEIGGKPILWHIMKIYSYYGFNDFIICLGYKGYIIKEYFVNYFMHNSDLTVSLLSNDIKFHQTFSEDWNVTLVDTGLNTGTAGRLKKIKKYINDDTFMMTYGDGVSNVNILSLLQYHYLHGKIATVTAVKPLARFGNLKFKNNSFIVKDVKEKSQEEQTFINGGFFVFNKKIFDYLIYDDSVMFERLPMETLSNSEELIAYTHNGFWSCMDTLHDKYSLEQCWNSGKALWKVW